MVGNWWFRRNENFGINLLLNKNNDFTYTPNIFLTQEELLYIQ